MILIVSMKICVIFVSLSSRISSSSSSAAQSHQYSRKLTKDSGYESAASSANWSSLGNINTNCLPTHSRSDSTESSVSTGDGLNTYKPVSYTHLTLPTKA